jgi:hypothetical protein
MNSKPEGATYGGTDDQTPHFLGLGVYGELRRFAEALLDLKHRWKG